MQHVFSVAGREAYRDVVASFSKVTEREFYDGDLEVDGDHLEVLFEKAISYPASLTRISSRCSIAYRRTWRHIRDNRNGCRVIWFISRGSLRIVRSSGVCEVPTGHGAIVDSSAPFYIKALPDSDGQYESLQLTVPGDLFLAHLKGADKLTEAIGLDTPQGAVVRRLLDLFVDEGECLSERSAKPLVEGLLEAIGESLIDRDSIIPARQTLVERRLADIKSHILMNLSDPDLSYDRVAANCGISPRYLCYLLKAHNTSFSQLLWQNRLPRARDLLLSPAVRDYPIHEIAFMCGFKSAAHFSRMFNATYGCPPRLFRLTNGAAARPSATSEAADGVCAGPREQPYVASGLNKFAVMAECAMPRQ